MEVLPLGASFALPPPHLARLQSRRLREGSAYQYALVGLLFVLDN
jgi:hypothetical protein